MRIRPTTLTDLPDVISLIGRAMSIVPSDINKHGKNWIKNGGCFTAFDENNSKLIGIAMSELKGGSMYVSVMCIDMHHRGEGYGSLLLSCIVTHTKQHNIDYISLHVQESNTDAVNFYKKNGFYPTGDVIQFYYGRRIPNPHAITMRRDLVDDYNNNMTGTLPIVVSFEELGISGEVVDVTQYLSIGELILEMSKRWEIESCFDITWSGSEALDKTEIIVNLGIESGDELMAVQREQKVTSYGIAQFESERQRVAIAKFFTDNPNAVCCIDAKSASSNNKIQTTDDWADLLPESIKKISFTNCDTITIIGNQFLSNCCFLESVDLSQFSNVTSIENDFLSGCSSLCHVDLSQLGGTKYIGKSFLSDCSNLADVNLSFLSNITMVGNNFLAGCKSLVSIDLSPLRNISFIGSYFLSNCRSLSVVDLHPISSVNHVGNNFLSNCFSLSSMDVSPLANSNCIGERFLFGCSGMSELDLLPLIDIPDFSHEGLLLNCGAVTEIDKIEFLRAKFLKEAGDNNNNNHPSGIW